MLRTLKKPTSKTLNELGQTYQNASKAQQTLFKGTLLKLSERDGRDYWRAFTEVWQTHKVMGLMPGAILIAAYHELDFQLK